MGSSDRSVWSDVSFVVWSPKRSTIAATLQRVAPWVPAAEGWRVRLVGVVGVVRLVGKTTATTETTATTATTATTETSPTQTIQGPRRERRPKAPRRLFRWPVIVGACRGHVELGPGRRQTAAEAGHHTAAWEATNGCRGGAPHGGLESINGCGDTARGPEGDRDGFPGRGTQQGLMTGRGRTGRAAKESRAAHEA